MESIMKKLKIRLIHWDSAAAGERAAGLVQAGFHVVADIPKGQEDMKALKLNPPDVFLIDLSRQPSHGLEMALYIRIGKPTRNVPIVFVGGEAEKVERVRAKLPDAVYTDWESAPNALRRAVENPPSDPVVPKSILDGYSGTPLAKKLGIKQGITVSLLNAPDSFSAKLEGLPENPKVVEGINKEAGLILWFIRTGDELSEKIAGLVPSVPGGGIWMIWPKKTGSLKSDLSQAAVRKLGLASGLVDYKVCSVDDDWSGLKFARRKT
jgi:CheY-like chemotaxis protein